MVMLVRHLLSFTLPLTVIVLVPLGIARHHDVSLRLAASPIGIGLQIAGCVVLGTGILLFTSSLGRFAVNGRGTLAPWDPPRHLVVRGPYRFVRNPMISGVIIILVGEALALLSPPHGVWAGLFLTLNLIFIPLAEEPQLEQRFGEPYRDYRRHVPRFLPRLTPWTPDTPPPG